MYNLSIHNTKFKPKVFCINLHALVSKLNKQSRLQLQNIKNKKNRFHQIQDVYYS